MENPIKKLIAEVQELLNENYYWYVFGTGSRNATDEETEYFINAFDDLQAKMEMLYKRWGYKFEKEYKKENLKTIDKTENS